MNTRPPSVLITILTSVLILATNWATAESKPQTPILENAALSEKKSRFFDEFHIAQNAQLSGYQKVYVLDPLVAFDKDWIRDNRLQVSQNYQAKTAARYAVIFKQQLVKIFEKDERFTVVNEKSDDALIIAANINDLDIYGPDDRPQIKQYVYRAGKGKLQVTLKTHQGKTLATFMDLRESRERGIGKPVRATSSLNEREFRVLMKKWSRQLAKHIASN